NDGCSSTSDRIQLFQLQNWKQKAVWTKKAKIIYIAEKIKNQTSELSIVWWNSQKINYQQENRAKIQQQLAKIHNDGKRCQHQ
ncbi:hypothetical protein HPG69_002590, partial [Diceros bicornis minor]